MYSRVIDGQILTLAASGWTFDFTFVLYDIGTESLWYHFEGEDGLTCIAGNYADRKLAELPSLKTRWSAWKAAHPTTKFMTSK